MAATTQGVPQRASDVRKRVRLHVLRRQRRFLAEPDGFGPGFLGPHGSANSRKGHCQPSGRGTRAGIDASSAMQETVLILSSLLQHHRLRPAPRVVSRLTVRWAKGVRVQLEALHHGAPHD